MPKPATPARRSRIGSLIALAFGYFIDQGEGQAMSVLFPTIKALWGLDYTALGTLARPQPAPVHQRALLGICRRPVLAQTAHHFWHRHLGLWTLACGLAQNNGQLWSSAPSRYRLGLFDAGDFLAYL